MNACSVDGCVRDSRANGMCDTHDKQFKRTGRTWAINARRPRSKPKPKPDPAPAFACGDCGQAVGSWAGFKTHTCKPRERTPVMPLPLKAVPDPKKRPHPRELVDHPSKQIARAAKRVMDAVAALDKAWAEKAELRAERDRLKAELAQVESRLRGGPTVVRDWKAIRAWAADEGLDCPATGKVPGGIVSAYDRAHHHGGS